MRFLCDAMLGHLARDLRALGHDTVLAGNEPDDEPVERARREGRAMVSKDRGLSGDAIVLAADCRDTQLAELAQRVDLGPARFLSRCLVCNKELVPADEAAAPADADGPVTRCPACGRTYWHGTHVEAMRARLGPYI